MNAQFRETAAGIVLDCLRLANRSRPVDRQLAVGLSAPLFGEDSSLDSLGLVALVIDVEDSLRELGVHIDLSTAHAMSRRHSPFRTVDTLVDYIVSRAAHAA